MAGYDETDFPVGDFARIITAASNKTDRRTRDLEKLDAASKQRIVPRMDSAEGTLRQHREWLDGHGSQISRAQATASDGVNRANNAADAANRAQATATTANNTANSAYNRTSDLYNQVADLRRRIEILERK